jgi:hypothetical protein
VIRRFKVAATSVFVCGLTLCLALACSGKGSSDTPDTPNPPASIAVTGVSIPATASVNVGSTTTLTATVTPSNATNKTVTWASSDTTIATVDASGVVSGVKAGPVNITAKSTDGSNITSTACAVTVNAAPVVLVTGVSIPAAASVTVGSATTLTATVTPSNATNKTVTWTSSDTTTATVNASGVVTGVKAGPANITAKSTDGSNITSAACAVTVTAAPVGTPSAPAGLTATSGVAEIDLSWSASTGATSYYILRSTTSGGPYTAVMVTTGTSYSEFGLVAGTKYYYVAQAANATGISGYPSEISATFVASHVSQDADGWTTVTPSSDSRQIYVSSSTGSDGNAGTQAAPLATIDKAASMLRMGYPDWILLKCGDVFHGQFGTFDLIAGRSADEPMVITSYGTGARPQIQPDGTDNVIGKQNRNNASGHLYIMGLDIYDARKDPSSTAYQSGASSVVGISWLDTGNDILVENNFFHFLAIGIVTQANATSAGPSNMRIRRNVFTDQYSFAGHSQGMFLSNQTGLIVEDNLFDHNAWNDAAGVPADVFNHHMYICDSFNVAIRGNLMLRDESLSLKFCSYIATPNSFAGALVENNFFFEGEFGIQMSYQGTGALSGSSFTGFTVRNNVMLQVDRDNPTGRDLGWGIQITSTAESFFTGNVFSDFHLTGNSFAISLDGGTGSITYPSTGVTIENNLAYRMKGEAVILESYPVFSKIKFLNNTIQDPDLGSVLIDVSGAFTPFSFSGNTYYDGANSSMAKTGTGASATYAQWVNQSGETGSSNQQISYPDPGRNLETYQQSLGGAASLDPIYAAVRAQSKTNWNPAYTAQAINDYIRAGFGLPPYTP